MEKKSSILVVDDDRLFLQTLSRILKAKGYLVTVVTSGPEAIQKTEENAFDCTLIDIRLPGIDGLETYKEIKKIRPGARVVIMTGYSVDELIDRALSEGVDEFISKPFNYEQLLRVLTGGKR